MSLPATVPTYSTPADKPKAKGWLSSALQGVVTATIGGGAQGVQEVELIDTRTPSQVPFYLTIGIIGIGGLALLYYFTAKK